VLAQLFARLGVTVTIAEVLDRLAPLDEPEVSAAIKDAFEDEGITICTGAGVTSVRGDTAGRSVRMKTAGGRERELAYSEILVTAGRRPVTGELNPAAAGVTTGARARSSPMSSSGPRTRGYGRPETSPAGRSSSTPPPPRGRPPPPTRSSGPGGRSTTQHSPG
jgi:hypothetical protein